MPLPAQNYSPVVAIPFIPANADIKAGTVTNSSGPLITIPAGRTWVGCVSVQGVIAPSVNAGAINGAVTVATDAAASPSAATVCAVVVASGASTSTSAASNATSGNMTMPQVVVTSGTSDSVLSLVGSGNISRWTGTAAGVLLP